ncbi:MAG: hypothetical protein HYY05_04320 [Chloroflexi bacterium]|nr:hypothetical protein [Chloroflexota bacterium]
MDLVFERGDGASPRGHGLLYFRSRSDPTAVLATYVIVPPVRIDLAKYMPAMLAAQLPSADSETIGVIPIPPLAEPVPDHATLEHLAQVRDEDLVFAGDVDAASLADLMSTTAEASRAYLALFRARRESELSPARPEPAPELDVAEVLYSMLPDRDRLAELTKLLGQLRYAIDGQDGRAAAEALETLSKLGRYLPTTYRMDELVQAASLPGDQGSLLAQLYLERCYRLSEQAYGDLERIDQQIRDARSAA